MKTTKYIRHEIEYTNQSVSTGDDYPQWWIQLPTNVLLSNYITNQGEKKKEPLSIPSPRQQQQLDQSIQTDIEIENLQRSSSRIHKSSSSVTINDNYEIIDHINDGNNSRRLLPFQDQLQRVK
jgi:hypothetical protein